MGGIGWDFSNPHLGKISLARSLGLPNTQPPRRAKAF